MSVHKSGRNDIVTPGVANEKKLTFDEWWQWKGYSVLGKEFANRIWNAAQENK